MTVQHYYINQLEISKKWGLLKQVIFYQFVHQQIKYGFWGNGTGSLIDLLLLALTTIVLETKCRMDCVAVTHGPPLPGQPGPVPNES